jgi:hypothetical protein
VKDPHIFELLEIAKQILLTQLQETSALLGEMAAPDA